MVAMLRVLRSNERAFSAARPSGQFLRHRDRLENRQRFETPVRLMIVGCEIHPVLRSGS